MTSRDFSVAVKGFDPLDTTKMFPQLSSFCCASQQCDKSVRVQKCAVTEKNNILGSGAKMPTFSFRVRKSSFFFNPPLKGFDISVDNRNIRPLYSEYKPEVRASSPFYFLFRHPYNTSILFAYGHRNPLKILWGQKSFRACSPFAY